MMMLRMGAHAARLRALTHPGTDRCCQTLLAVGMTLVGALALLPALGVAAQRASPMEVVGFRGRYCMSMGPRGWAIVAEDAERVSFGADSLSADGKVAASYAIFGVGANSMVRGYETPDRGVAMSVSRMGAERVQFGQRQQIDRNVFTISYRTPTSDGMAYWQVVPTGPNAAMIVLRTAYTASGLWSTRGAEAGAVARSLHCNVPSVPPSPDPPSLNPPHGSHAKPDDSGGESDSLYNQWLDKEYYHNPKTGENFWVSPSHDWDQNGPEGPGYYAQHANGIIKLESGYAQ